MLNIFINHLSKLHCVIVFSFRFHFVSFSPTGEVYDFLIVPPRNQKKKSTKETQREAERFLVVKDFVVRVYGVKSDGTQRRGKKVSQEKEREKK